MPRAKGVLGAILLSALLVLLVGCGDFAPEGHDDGQVQNSKDGYFIGVSFPTTQLAFRASMTDLVEQHYGDSSPADGVRVSVKDAAGSERQQNQDIIDLVNDGVDGIVLVPGSVEGQISAVKYANDQGVPVITVDNRIEASASAESVSFVGANHYEMGKQAAELLVSCLKEKWPTKSSWNVVELSGPPEASGTIDRGQGIDDYFAENASVSLVGSYNASFTSQNARSVIEDLLVLDPGIDGVICQNDLMALGCQQAIAGAGKTGQIVVVGIDGQASAVQAIEQGGIDGTVAQSPEMVLRGIELLCSYLDGGQLEPVYYEETVVVSSNNASSYLSSHTNW